MTSRPAFAPVRRARPDYARPLMPTGNLRRRQLVSNLASAGAMASAALAVGVLGIVVFEVVKEGISAISFSFLTQGTPLLGTGGGIAPEIVGTAVIVLLAALISVPVGILVALFITEFAPRGVGQVIRTVLDVLNGVPSIVIGVFVFGLLVVGSGESGLAASVALAIIMLPLIARSTQEMLLLIPRSLREASEALGVSRWRTVVGVLLPGAMAGIITGTVLAVARAAGETAPLIVLDAIYGNGVTVNPFGQTVPNIPVEIFKLSEADDPSGFTRAWGAALVLLTLILIANVGARALFARSRRIK